LKRKEWEAKKILEKIFKQRRGGGGGIDKRGKKNEKEGEEKREGILSHHSKGVHTLVGRDLKRKVWGRNWGKRS